MYAVTGATGALGRLVINHLLKQLPAEQIIAVVRSAERAKDIAALGVVIREADYDQPETLVAAFEGVENLLFISSSQLDRRVEQHRAVVGAAQTAKVGYLVYTSILHADTSTVGFAKDHRDTEAVIRASGIPFAILRNGWYSENYLQTIESVLQHGEMVGAAGDGLISSAAREDYAEAAAIVLRKKEVDVTYELAGDESWSLADLASIIGHQSGQIIRYVDLDDSAFHKSLLDVGLPDVVADILTNIDVAVKSGALLESNKLLSQLIGRPTTPIECSVHSALTARSA